MGKNKKYGNIYELKLPNEKYVYICWVREFSFAVFDYYSENSVDSIEKLQHKGFKIFKSGKETAIRKKVWKLVGHIDLEKENIKWPDLASYRFWDIEGSIENSKVMRNGNLVNVTKKKFLKLVEKGYIYGFFDKPEIFEKWLVEHIEDYPKNVKW